MILFIILIGITTFIFWNHRYWQALPWPSQGVSVPRFQAHRGFHETEVENTLAAFRAARTQGAEMFELDVRLSKDLVPIVFHDIDLQRIVGRPERVCDLNLKELQQLTNVPTLQEVLMDPDSPSLLNIELKAEMFWCTNLVKAVSLVVRDSHAQSRVLFSSFNPVCIYLLAQHIPEVPRALLATGEADKGNKIYLKKLWLAPYVGANLLHLDWRHITTKDIQKYKSRGIPVALWIKLCAVLI
jgi:glycerophosphoryl diester phosphodiesterase